MDDQELRDRIRQLIQSSPRRIGVPQMQRMIPGVTKIAVRLAYATVRAEIDQPEAAPEPPPPKREVRPCLATAFPIPMAKLMAGR